MKPFRRSGCNPKSLLVGWERSGNPSGGLVGVVMRFQRARRVESPFRRTKRGSKALPVGQDRSRDPHGGPAGVLMSFQSN